MMVSSAEEASVTMEPESTDSNSDRGLRKAADIAALSGATLLGAYFFVWLIYHSASTKSSAGWFTQTIEKHYAATIGVPLSAVSALCVVVALRATAGPVEFEAFGFKFRRASGPLVFWLICFVAMVWGDWLLWTLV